MWKMIIGQALYQTVATFILHFAGPQFLPYPEDQMRSLIFNMFVWLQIFNQYNNRRLDNKLNIFVGIHKNYYFIAMNVIMVAAQVLIAMYGSTAFSIVRINGEQWAISVVVALLCVPWGVCVRLFPDEWFGLIAKVVGRPFVLAYRPLARVTDRVMGKMRKNKKVGTNSDDGSFMGRGKSPVQTIGVKGDAEKGLM
jgi:Ca2+-transporting ATPase